MNNIETRKHSVVVGRTEVSSAVVRRGVGAHQTRLRNQNRYVTRNVPASHACKSDGGIAGLFRSKIVLHRGTLQLSQFTDRIFFAPAGSIANDYQIKI